MKTTCKLTTVIFILSILLATLNCKKDKLNEAPQKPILVSPSNNAVLETIPLKLDWNCIDNDSDSLIYELYFGTNNPPGLLISDINKSYYSEFTVESQEAYYWKVIAQDEQGNKTESDVWAFTMGNFPPETPTNPNPADNSVDQDPVTISWECTEPDGESLTYDIYFGTTNSPELIEEDYTENSYELSELYGSQKYYWRIIAKDSYGNEINGPLWNFNTTFFPPELIYPADSDQNGPWFPKLQWECNNADDLTYDVYLGTSNNPPLLTRDIINTFYYSDRLTKEQTYYWKVVAKKDGGVTSESRVWSFTVFGDPQFDTYTDSRDGITYQTVKIGNQTWFAENLKYFVESSRVYDDDPANEEIYGRLYTFNQMMNGEEASNENPSGIQGIAPPDWHIPSKAEWFELIEFLGGQYYSYPSFHYINAGKRLKEAGTEHWNTGNTGDNESGFTALGGGAFINIDYYQFLKCGYYRSCTTEEHWTGFIIPIRFVLYANSNKVYFEDGSNWSVDAFSVRCVKN